MNTWIKVEVTKRKDARLIEKALQRPDVRAFCLIVGALGELPDDNARSRVMRYIDATVNDLP